MNHPQNSPLADQLDVNATTDLISRRRQVNATTTVFVLTTAYAVARYIYFGDVSAENIPTYILNKSISMSAVVFLLLSSWQHALGNKQAAKSWGASSLHFAVLHIVMSMVLLSESYYPKLYSDGKMNLNGEVCILFGVLASYFYVILSSRARSQQFLPIICLAASAICAHLFFMGYQGWFKTASWPGQLPPISLLSFLIGVAAFVIYLALLLRTRRSELM